MLTVKNKPQIRRKTFVYHTSDKHLVFKIHKELLKEHNNKKINKMFKKWIKYMNTYFTKGNI